MLCGLNFAKCDGTRIRLDDTPQAQHRLDTQHTPTHIRLYEVLVIRNMLWWHFDVGYDDHLLWILLVWLPLGEVVRVVKGLSGSSMQCVDCDLFFPIGLFRQFFALQFRFAACKFCDLLDVSGVVSCVARPVSKCDGRCYAQGERRRSVRKIHTHTQLVLCEYKCRKCVANENIKWFYEKPNSLLANGQAAHRIRTPDERNGKKKPKIEFRKKLRHTPLPKRM